MKQITNFKKARLLLTAVLALFVGGLSPAWADNLTVHDGTESSYIVPIYGYRNDSYVKMEYILPATEISEMAGGTISGLTYYLKSSESSSYGNANFVVFLKEVGETTITAFSGYTNEDIVYQGSLDATGATLSISFSKNYVYGGGNLLIGIYNTTKGTAGGWQVAYYYGTTATSGASAYGYSSQSMAGASYVYKQTFLPKTTFAYTAASCKPPKNFAIASITSESADLSWGKGDEGDAAWQIVYSTDENFDKDAATPIDVNTTSYTLTGLEQNTTYYAAVRTYAGSGDGEQSAWVTRSFKTTRAPITSFPWTESFNSLSVNGTIPDGWDNSEGTTTSSDYKWCYNSSYSTGYDGKCIRFDSYNNSNGRTNFLKTPVMNFIQNAAMQLKFWYKNPTGGDFSVYISNDGGATYEESLATGLTGASSWTEKVIDLPTDEYYENVVIVFKGTSNYGSGDARIYLDEVLVKENASYAMSISGGDVVSNTIAFGEVKNTSTTKTFTISNDGANDLTSVSVVSSDASVFTVSDTDFDIASGETKDITVTFVKGVVGDYDETITVSQANIGSPFVLAVTASYATPSAAAMVVKDGEEVVGETIAFGNVGKTKSKTITVVNTGEADLNVTSITSSNTTDFTVSPSTLTVHGGSSETFTVTFVWDGEAMNAEKSATITVTASNAGVDPKAFTVTGTRVELWSEDFSGNALPEGWEAGSNWSFSDGLAKAAYAYGTSTYLTTPSLIVAGTEEELTFDYEATANYVTVKVQYSKDGADFVNYSGYPSSLNNGDAGTFTITGLEAGNYKFRFANDDYQLDNFEGFKRNINDPKMGIYSDEECTVAVATSVTNDFGFATTDQTATYYIKNVGTGTMTLSKGDNPAGFTATLDKTSVAAGEHATLTITMPAADNAGYHSGNIVVTATDLGTFTVAANGVIRDGDKMYLDFSSDNIPATWTANNWTKNGAGYIENSTYSSSSVETAILTAEAGEEVVIEAKMFTSSYTLGVNYKKQGDAEWSTLIEAANIGTEWTKLRATIADAGKYQLQFVGTRAQIRRIYGLAELNEPVMVVYDDEEVAGSTHNFGNVSDEADATWTLTVKNEGKTALTGLAAALSGINAAHYSVEVSATELAVNATTTITVKQLKDNIGAHEATLTISADDPIADKVIALSGFTFDHNKLFVDFEGGSFPAGWTTNSWTVATTSGNQHARAGYTASSLITTPLTVGEDESLVFKAKRQYSGSAPTFQIRYTTNGGVTWSEYADYASQVTSGDFTNITLSGISAGTAIVEIYGRYLDLDDFYGFAPTTAPVLSLTESAVAVASGSTKEFGNLTEAGAAIYTLSNTGTANLVSTVATSGVATAAISGEGEGVTISENTVTLEPGKSATITLTLPYVAPYGDKVGAMTISSEGWVGDMVVNYTATTIDPTALYVDFNDNAKPAGWYQEASGWVISTGRAHVYTGVAKALVTEQYAAEDGKNVLRFDAKKQSNYADGELKVYTSTDRNTWMLAKTVALTEDDQAVALDALADGNYYVKFESSNASIDNLAGLKRILPAPAHDLYVTATTFPATALVPSTVAGVNATATVASLRANETGVYAKLFFDEDVVATAEPKAIDLNSTATFTLTGNVPATEKTYAAKIIVYYSDESVAWETGTVDVEVAHTRTLSITDFARVGEGDIDADENNQFDAAFNVTVQNTGSTAATPVVKIFIGETEVGTATADAAVAAGGSKTIAVNVTDASAGEGGELEFTAKAYWTAEGAALATSASNVTITVNATAPKFALYQDATPVNDGDDVDFGLVKGTTETFSYTIKNEGSAALVLKSIVAPAGFTATEVTEVNKTIAPAGTLTMDVTLNAEQGKVSGNLVITYRVDAMTDNTFTLALSGRSVAADTWTEDFESGSIPANWTNDNGWTVDETDGNHYARLTGWNDKSIMSPRLEAAKDEELTFDVLSVGNTFSYAYSTDKVNWSDEVVIDATGEQTFTAPAAGNYYLRFTTRNGRLDNLVGFRLNPLNLTLNESSSNSFIAANYDNVTLNRAFIAGWNTVCLPFAIDNINAFFGDGAYAYAFDNYTDGNITFAKQDAMDAATPYLVFVPEAIASKELKNLAISDAAAGSVGVENTFTGTYAPIAAGGLTNKFVLTPQARIQKAGSGATMNAFRAYFTIPSGLVKALVFDDGTTTSVMKIDVTGNESVRDIFDLAGRKLNETRKGINIVNGKKVLVK